MSQLLKSLVLKEGYEKTEVFYKYIRVKAAEKGVPLSGSFELTPQCTLDCKMCYVHLNKDKIKHAELTTEQWLSLIDQACNAGMLYATLTGGECLMFSGFKTIYEYLQSKGVLVTIFTNATLLDENMVAWLSDRKPHTIQISVYGSSPVAYESVTGNGDAFYRVDEAINLLNKVGIPYKLAITASKYMINDFDALYRYCKGKNSASLNLCTFPFPARNETDRDYNDYAPSIADQAELFKTRQRIDGKKSIEVYNEDKFDYGQFYPEIKLEHESKGISCDAGRIRFSISWDGKMHACTSFYFAEAFPLEVGFDQSWQYIRRRSREYVMPVECETCDYKRACIKCPAAHWHHVGEGHCSPLICQEGKRMVSEGLRKL